jgi:hypothetical protein
MAAARLLASDEYPIAKAFIHEHWRSNHAYCRSKALFDWTFQQNPAWPSRTQYSFAIAQDQGRTTGMLGVIPFTLNDRGSTYPACWLCNWYVIPEARKGQHSLSFLRLFTGAYGYHTVSFGINDRIAELYRALRWALIPDIRRVVWVSPVDRDAASEFLREGNPTSSEDEICALLDVAARPLEVEQPPIATNFEDMTAGDWDGAGWGPFARALSGCSRDEAYLRWRYLEHPTFKYRLVTVPDGDRLGLIGWRIDTTNRQGDGGVLEPFYKMARIIEFLPTSRLNAEHLLGIFKQHIMNEGVVAADCYGFHSGFMQWMIEFGFREIAPDRATVPNYTQPIAAGGHVIRSAMKTSVEPPRECDDHWYWTRSDSDQDRPN